MSRLRFNKNASKILEENIYFIKDFSSYKGKWNKFFSNNNDLRIEIGSGKGDFIIEKSLKCKNVNFLGIDKYETILLKIHRKIKEHKITNFAFSSYDALNLKDVFEEGEVNKIYLNFSDPWPKSRHEKRRLTSFVFMEIYKNILNKNGDIEFKTDNDQLYEYTLNMLREKKWNIKYYTNDLYNSKFIENNTATEYEKKFIKKNIKIKKICFNF